MREKREEEEEVVGEVETAQREMLQKLNSKRKAGMMQLGSIPVNAFSSGSFSRPIGLTRASYCTRAPRPNTLRNELELGSNSRYSSRAWQSTISIIGKQQQRGRWDHAYTRSNPEEKRRTISNSICIEALQCTFRPPISNLRRGTPMAPRGTEKN